MIIGVRPPYILLSQRVVPELKWTYAFLMINDIKTGGLRRRGRICTKLSRHCENEAGCHTGTERTAFRDLLQLSEQVQPIMILLWRTRPTETYSLMPLSVSQSLVW